MRLDKYLADSGRLSRREAAEAVRKGQVTVDGRTVKNPSEHIDAEKNQICLGGEPICYKRLIYILLNKPAGLVSSTEDPHEETVLQLLEAPLRRQGVFPCGRLDKDTVGLLLLTNDGALAHRLTSPKHHVSKTYRYELAEPAAAQQLSLIEAGLLLEDGTQTRPCRIEADTETSGRITLTEGKYHEIKRMFGAVGNRVVVLERLNFGSLKLDPALARGQWRYLTETETEELKQQ